MIVECSRCHKPILKGSFSDATIPSPNNDGTEWHWSCAWDEYDEIRARTMGGK
jgi:hypothetical protein